MNEFQYSHQEWTSRALQLLEEPLMTTKQIHLFPHVPGAGFESIGPLTLKWETQPVVDRGARKQSCHQRIAERPWH